MLLTEGQAREKWCPMARVPSRCGGVTGQYEVAANRGVAMDKPYDQARCIASDCMMWRWGESAETADKDRGRVGFCGLAADWRYP